MNRPAKLLTLKELTEQTQQDLPEILQKLRCAGIRDVDSFLTIERFANNSELTSRELMEAASNYSEDYGVTSAGYRRETINGISIILRLDENLVMQQMQKNNIQFEKNQILKEITNRYNFNPSDRVNMISGEGEYKLEEPS